jgi:anthranilate phosphoribosyltransferase
LELGVNIEVTPSIAERALEEVGICFLFAPLFHPAMKRVAKIRRELGRRTIFNIVGPLVNPASAPVQLVGVYEKGLTEKLAQALVLLGTVRAWVVHGEDGMDEISPSAKTRVAEVRGKGLRVFDLEASTPGQELPPGGGPSENAGLVRAVLSGEGRGVEREVVVLNAAAAIHLATEMSFQESRRRAEEAIDSGKATEKLEELSRLYRVMGG